MDGAIINGVFAEENTKAVKQERILPLFSLKGRTAIISGAGAGIGLEVAKAFAEAGANLVIWYNSNKKALERAEEIAKEYGVKCNWARILVLLLLFLCIDKLIQARHTKST